MRRFAPLLIGAVSVVALLFHLGPPTGKAIDSSTSAGKAPLDPTLSAAPVTGAIRPVPVASGTGASSTVASGPASSSPPAPARTATAAAAKPPLTTGSDLVPGFPRTGLIKTAAALPVGDAADQALSASLAIPETNIVKQVTVGRGDTLMKLLEKQAVPRTEAHAVATALAPVFDLRRLQIGQKLTLTFGPEPRPADTPDDGAMGDDIAAEGETGRDLIELAFRPSVDRDILVALKDDEGYEATIIERDLRISDALSSGLIDSSLYEAAIAGGTPIDVLMRLIRVFSFDVDFQRDIQQGDTFEVLYEQHLDETGTAVRNGDIHFAAMTLSGKRLELFRYTPKSGFTDYFDRKGRSVRKTLMRTPVDGARLSSRYGMRKHPVLGYSKMHRGIDFAAPNGTPIMAAGDGVIESIGRNDGYGKYIRVRHSGGYKTAYAHMSGYAKGLRKGSRVRQGDVIGYVGSTGRSTGPHLHYEVMVNNRQVNPLSVKLPAGENLQGKELLAFQRSIEELDPRIAGTGTGIRLASD